MSSNVIQSHSRLFEFRFGWHPECFGSACSTVWCESIRPYLPTVGLIILAAIVQSCISGVAWLANAKVPLLTCVVISYALLGSEVHTTVAAVTAGYIQDSLSPLPLGLSVVILLVSAKLIHRAALFLFPHRHPLALYVCGGVGVCLCYGLLAAGVLLGDCIRANPAALLLNILGTVMLAMFLVLPVSCLIPAIAQHRKRRKRTQA